MRGAPFIGYTVSMF